MDLLILMVQKEFGLEFLNIFYYIISLCLFFIVYFWELFTFAASSKRTKNLNLKFFINKFINVGDVAAILFFLLSIQSGISSLNGNQRVEKFLKNYSLLFIAILHYLHTGLDSQLTTLSASSNPHWFNEKHLRLLSVCLSLIILPGFILSILWSYFRISTWLLAATAFNVELIVKMSVSLLLYGLFLFDSKRIKSAYDKLVNKQSDSRTSKPDGERIDELSDNLDDYIYYVKAFGHIGN